MRIVRAGAETAPRVDLLPTAEDLAFARGAVASADVEPVVLLRRPGMWLALECLQAEGSFKIRGAAAALARLSTKGITRVVAASAGNHGIGVASAAAKLGIAATIVVPKSAPRKKVDAIRALGAEILEEGDGYDAAESFALELAERRGDRFVSPYDDVDVVAGNGGTLGLEIAEALARRGAPPPSLVLAPFGGGGLATGLACVLGPERIVWGVQSEASPAFAMSLERGQAVTSLPPADTLADGIEGGIAPNAFARAAGVCAGVIVVSEEAIGNTMRFAFRDLGLVIEGSAAAALAPIIEGLPAEVVASGDVVVVLTGRNVDRDRLAKLVW
jgi:threonine dehydratase